MIHITKEADNRYKILKYVDPALGLATHGLTNLTILDITIIVSNSDIEVKDVVSEEDITKQILSKCLGKLKLTNEEMIAIIRSHKECIR